MAMIPAGMVLQHLLVFVLIVVMPLWDRYEIPRLKASTEPRKKIRYYGKIVTVLWVLALGAVLTIGPKTAVTTPVGPVEMGWLGVGTRGRAVVLGMIAGIMGALFIPAVMAVWNTKLREKSGKAAKRLGFLLPSTGEERQWWWAICLTAGICEEIVYRGFLIHYWRVAPFHLSVTWALVVSAAIFGIGHLYQGIAGGVQTAMLGFLLGALFLITGDLLVPMMVHAVLDLRALLLLPEGFETAHP